MTHQSRLAVTRELEGFRYSARQLIKAAPLPDIPLIVLTRGLQKWPHDERGNRMEALWQQLQTELVHKTADAAQIIALNSGHHIHLDQPDLVVDAICLVAKVHQARAAGREREVMRTALRETARRFYGQAMVASDLLQQPMVAMDSLY
jgi:hypothetical protein